MTLVADAKALWRHIITNVTADQAVNIITAVTTGLHETATGEASSVLASIENRNPEAFEVIKELATSAAGIIGGPLASGGISIAFSLLAMSHSMTPEEEQVWFDRQSSGSA